jgi:hypothetical protein
MRPYKYTPISTTAAAFGPGVEARRLGIRLLHIRPGAFKEDIQID